MTSSTSSTAVLVAGSAALLVAGIGMLSRSHQQANNNNNNTSTLAEIDEDFDESECITEDEVAKLFDSLFVEMQGILSQLMQQVQQLQMAGQVIPEKQLKTIVKNEMERALLVKQKALLEQFDMDYECWEQATWEFLEKEEQHPKVKKAVERFQRLWESATGEDVVGWRPGKESGSSSTNVQDVLSPEQTIQMAEVYFAALTESMRSIVHDFKTRGHNLQDPQVQQALNMEFAKSASDVGEGALVSHNVTQAQFEASVKQHSSNPTVGRALAMLQMKQQQDMMAMGNA